MSEYVPEEVLIEIFLKLPTKSIIQCTSVCKSWYSLITSPNFISVHLNNQDDYLLVRHCSGEPAVKEFYALFCDNENFDQYAQFDFPFECYSVTNIVGCCNGILCLSDDNPWDYRDCYYIWNPSIRKSVKLPEPIFISRTGPFRHTLGFGFDSVTNDYKLVRIVHNVCATSKVAPRVEVFKLSTGVWQDITPVSPFYQFSLQKPGLYVNGSCHWVASKGERKGPTIIVLFDVHEETFWEMMVPDSLVRNFSGFFCEELVLFVSDESLCLADSSSGNDKTIDIWMMKEYGDPESWVKQFSISLRDISFNIGVVDEIFSLLNDGRQRQVAHFLEKPLASRKNGEILWRADNGLLVSYDPIAGKIKNLGIHESSNYNTLYVNTYKVSLILLGKQTYCFAGDTLCKRKAKGGRKKFLKANTKSGLQILHVKNEINEAMHDKTDDRFQADTGDLL